MPISRISKIRGTTEANSYNSQGKIRLEEFIALSKSTKDTYKDTHKTVQRQPINVLVHQHTKSNT